MSRLLRRCLGCAGVGARLQSLPSPLPSDAALTGRIPPMLRSASPDRLAPVAAIEAEFLKALRESIADLHVVGVSGLGANNKFDVPGWDLSLLRQFQFGDLRIDLHQQPSHALEGGFRDHPATRFRVLGDLRKRAQVHPAYIPRPAAGCRYRWHMAAYE
jgi:hypothetical protein